MLAALTSCGGDVVSFVDARSPDLSGLPLWGTYYYQSDHVGSTSILTDSMGAKVTEISYTPYGNKHSFNGVDLFKIFLIKYIG